MTYGITEMPIRLLRIEAMVPSKPEVLVDSRSKLKIWQMRIVAKSCLIRDASGLTLM